MYPEIHIGPLTLQTFGLMFALAFLAAGALIAKRLGEIGKPVDWAYEMGFAALIGGIVGSRVYFIVQNYDSVKDDLLGNLFSGSGLVWYGGAIGGALAVLALGLVPRLPRPRPARPGGAGAGARLRDRPLRLPALRRRRLRQGLERALGDVLPGRHRADRPKPSTRRRSTRRWRWGSAPGSSGSCATASGPASSSRSTSSTRAPSASWSSSCAATTPSALGLTGAAAREPGDDGRRSALDLRGEAPPRYALPRRRDGAPRSRGRPPESSALRLDLREIERGGARHVAAVDDQAARSRRWRPCEAVVDAAAETIAAAGLRRAARRRRSAGRRRARRRASRSSRATAPARSHAEVARAIEERGRAPRRARAARLHPRPRALPRARDRRRRAGAVAAPRDRAAGRGRRRAARGRPRARGRHRLRRDRPGPAHRAARPAGHRLRPLAGSGRSRPRERRAARPRPRGHASRRACPTRLERTSTWSSPTSPTSPTRRSSSARRRSSASRGSPSPATAARTASA